MHSLRFLCDNHAHEKQLGKLLGCLPSLRGRPLHIVPVTGLTDRYGAVHAGSWLRQRRIAFDCDAREFPRIFVHELFHFVWLRLGNPRRWSYERLLASEIRAGARGELGWSAEWRKQKLTAEDRRLRTRRWREYCCESFCDSAAWLYTGMLHPEFTLAVRFRQQRRRWFQQTVPREELSI
jgi:hypothetical protein